jgi:hypothetical protein
MRYFRYLVPRWFWVSDMEVYEFDIPGKWIVDTRFDWYKRKIFSWVVLFYWVKSLFRKRHDDLVDPIRMPIDNRTPEPKPINRDEFITWLCDQCEWDEEGFRKMLDEDLRKGAE